MKLDIIPITTVLSRNFATVSIECQTNRALTGWCWQTSNFGHANIMDILISLIVNQEQISD